MASSKTVVVTGATGTQGGAVLGALLGEGYRLRALTRNPDSAAAQNLRQLGVEIAGGDFSDKDSLARAADGADAAYVMSTPFEHGVEQEIAQGVAMVDACRAAGIGHLVLSSVASADRATGIPHFDSKYVIERHVESSGVPFTIVAPVFFMDNLLTPPFAANLRQGKLAMALPADRRLQQIAVADIGAFVASVIRRGSMMFGKRFDSAGDELTGTQAARVLSSAIGREISYEGFPPAALRQHSDDLATMFQWFADIGYSVDIDALSREFPDVPWHRFSQWAREQHWNTSSSG